MVEKLYLIIYYSVGKNSIEKIISKKCNNLLLWGFLTRYMIHMLVRGTCSQFLHLVRLNNFLRVLPHSKHLTTLKRAAICNLYCTTCISVNIYSKGSSRVTRMRFRYIKNNHLPEFERQFICGLIVFNEQ